MLFTSANKYHCTISWIKTVQESGNVGLERPISLSGGQQSEEVVARVKLVCYAFGPM